MNRPKIEIVVTQHVTLVELLRERGVIDEAIPVIEHARPEDVRGRHVLGVLPHHLSSQAASITEIPIRFADADERREFAGGDIPLARLRRMAGEPVTYIVRQVHGGGIDRSRPRWLAVARAHEHVERYGTHFGAGPHVSASGNTFKGLMVTHIWDATHQHQAYVIECRGVWKPDCKGPWLDGYGLPVDEDTIAPAARWADEAADV